MSGPLAIGVQICLWLLLVLLPLRGFAAVQMVTPGTPQGSAPAACHDIVADAPAEALQTEPESLAAQGHAGASCACCLFCAPALPGAAAAVVGLAPDGGLLPQPERYAMPEGVRDALFRPPRG